MLENSITTPNLDLRIWGKWKDGQSYPLIAHMIDTSASVSALWTHWLSISLKNLLLAELGPDALRIIKFLAGAHDLGKISDNFQTQRLHRPKEFESHAKNLDASGYPQPLPDRLIQRHSPELAPVFRHELLSQEYFDERATFLPVLSGHHGRYLTKEVLEDVVLGAQPRIEAVIRECYYGHYQLPSSSWNQQAFVHYQTLKDLIFQDLPTEFPQAPLNLTPLLTAMVSLADWLASDERATTQSELFGQDMEKLNSRLLTNKQQYYEEKEEYFRHTLNYTLGTPHWPKASFQETFKIKSLRPAQQTLLEIDPEPGLHVIMLPMGEGKTEIALSLAQRLSAKTGTGLYFALPTMATSDAMFARVKEFFSSEPQTFATLAHSKSMLNSFYSPSDVLNPFHDEPSSGLSPNDWFRGAHRQILAPVGVGTIDQLLKGFVKTKYNFLDILGASQKILVLDEVHSYSPYTAHLIDSMLAWLGRLRVSVVILSATLPKVRVSKMTSSYTGNPTSLAKIPFPGYLYAPPPSFGTHLEQIPLQTTDFGSREVSLIFNTANRPIPQSAVEQVHQLIEAYPEAKIGVLLNTVDDVITTATALKDLSPLVLHSRFIANQRNFNTKEAQKRFGKEAPLGFDILIASQVAEQSLDLDFDILISAMAPLSSLIQRIGRLWRHPTRTARPTATPSAYIIAPTSSLETLKRLSPYSPGVMSRSWRAIAYGEKNSITIPDELQDLVDESFISYEELENEATLPSSEMDLALDNAIKTQQARVFSLPPPSKIRTKYDLFLFTGELTNHTPETRDFELIQEQVFFYDSSSQNALVFPSSPPSENNISFATLQELLGFVAPINSQFSKLFQSIKEHSTAPETRYKENSFLKNLYLCDISKIPNLMVNSYGIYLI